MPAGALLFGSGRLDDPCAMHTLIRRRAALRGTVATLAMVTALIACASAGAEQSDLMTASFDAVTTAGDWRGGQALGTFNMTGTLGDAGTARIAYQVFGRHVRATATLIGAKGILTIGLRATVADVLDDHENAVGRWSTFGGTGPYRRLVGHGDWTAVVDVLAAPARNQPRALHGAYFGRIHRSSAVGRAALLPSSDVRC